MIYPWKSEQYYFATVIFWFIMQMKNAQRTHKCKNCGADATLLPCTQLMMCPWLEKKTQRGWRTEPGTVIYVWWRSGHSFGDVTNFWWRSGLFLVTKIWWRSGLVTKWGETLYTFVFYLRASYVSPPYSGCEWP